MPGGNPKAALHVAKKKRSRIQRVVAVSLAGMAIGFGGSIGAEAAGHHQLSHDLFDGGLAVLVVDFVAVSPAKDLNKLKIQRLQQQAGQDSLSK